MYLKYFQNSDNYQQFNVENPLPKFKILQKPKMITLIYPLNDTFFVEIG